MHVVLVCFLVAGASEILGQHLVFPSQPGWTQVEEGKTMSFELT